MKLCKVEGCGAWYRPERHTWHAKLGVCYVHRKAYYKKWHRTHFLPWLKKQSPEKQAQYKKMHKDAWDKWVATHIDRRRSQALASYHKNKEKRQKRRNAKRRALYAARKASRSLQG